jgi:hypothetical protein
MAKLFATFCISTTLLGFALAGEIEVRNSCGERIYVKNAGSNRGPFFLNPGQTAKFQLNQDASSRVWAHRG